VIICEYWYKKPYEKTIVQMSDGTVVDGDEYEKNAKLYAQQQPPITEKQRKTIDCEKVYMEIVSGTQRLEGPYEWAGKNIPLIPVWGDIINIEGRDIWSGATRFAKDSQRLFNFSESTKLEVMANQPQQPLTGPVEAITGLETYYNSLSDANVPFLPYNLVPGAPNSPTTSRPRWASMTPVLARVVTKPPVVPSTPARIRATWRTLSTRTIWPRRGNTRMN
jgi:hypothetical protein